MAVAKPIRYLAAFMLIVSALFFLQTFRNTEPPPPPDATPSADPRTTVREGADAVDPQSKEISEPVGPLWRSDKYAADNPESPRINATLLALVRNKEVDGMVQSMRDLERTWNSKFNYPWTFFNDEPFSHEFMQRTQAETKAKCHYEVIPKEHWAVPGWINDELFQESANVLHEQGVQYSHTPSYRQMCRWNSGLFYHHPALKDTKWYWRVEPNVHFFCDVDYDVFRWMEDHNKTYGFTINLYDDPKTIPTLWPETEKFLAAHPEYLNENNAMGWLTDDKRRPNHNKQAGGYSTCHFWSNFEIGDMNFWRSRAYEDYFNHLDRAGGFYYERWGDAPVHSIALGLFEDKEKIHWYTLEADEHVETRRLTANRFRDIGYQHIPFFNCPTSKKCSGCVPGMATDGEPFLYKEDCRWNWFKDAGLTKAYDKQ